MNLYTVEHIEREWHYYDIVCARSEEEAKKIVIGYHEEDILDDDALYVVDLETTCDSDTPKVISSIMMD